MDLPGDLCHLILGIYGQGKPDGNEPGGDGGFGQLSGGETFPGQATDEVDIRKGGGELCSDDRSIQGAAGKAEKGLLHRGDEVGPEGGFPSG